jgi:hypothetical protein
MTAAAVTQGLDNYLAGLAYVEAYDSQDVEAQVGLLHTHSEAELIAGLAAVASMLRQAVAGATLADIRDVTGQMRDDILHTAARHS